MYEKSGSTAKKEAVNNTSKKIFSFLMRPAVRISFIYAIIGSLWVLVSDRIVLTLFHNPVAITTISTYKGWAFVLGTSFLLYILIRNDMRTIQKAQKDLKKQQNELEVIFNSVPAMIFYKDKDLKVVRINKNLENVMGLSEKDYVGKSMHDILHREDAEKFEKEDLEMLATGKSMMNIIESVNTPRGIRWFRTDKVLLRDETGNVAGIIGFGADITDWKNADEELKRLNKELEKRVLERTSQLEDTNKELETFSFSVSHDLKAPLRAIDGFSRILEEDYSNSLGSDCMRIIGIIRKNTNLMLQLIDDLLSFSRLSKTQINKTDIDMDSLICALVEDLKQQNTDRKIIFKIMPLENLFGDISMFRQVIFNILSNSVKFTRNRELAEIEIGCTRHNREVVYYCRDNGVGFDMKYAGKLFGVFQRMHTEDEFEGQGIGLSIIQRIIHKHGGRVWIEAEKNIGTTVYFTVPGKTTE